MKRPNFASRNHPMRASVAAFSSGVGASGCAARAEISAMNKAVKTRRAERRGEAAFMRGTSPNVGTPRIKSGALLTWLTPRAKIRSSPWVHRDSLLRRDVLLVEKIDRVLADAAPVLPRGDCSGPVADAVSETRSFRTRTAHQRTRAADA